MVSCICCSTGPEVNKPTSPVARPPRLLEPATGGSVHSDVLAWQRQVRVVVIVVICLALLHSVYCFRPAGYTELAVQAALCKACLEHGCSSNSSKFSNQERRDAPEEPAEHSASAQWYPSAMAEESLQCLSGLCVPASVLDSAEFCQSVQASFRYSIQGLRGRKLLRARRIRTRPKLRRRHQLNRDKHSDYFKNRELRELGSEAHKQDGSGASGNTYLRIHIQRDENSKRL